MSIEQLSTISESDMILIRYFLGYLLMVAFTDDAIVSEVAERNDTGKWIALKLFPHEKRSQRIEDRNISSEDITYERG